MTRIEIAINEAYRETLQEIKQDKKLTWKQKRAARRAVTRHQINTEYALHLTPLTLLTILNEVYNDQN